MKYINILSKMWLIAVAAMVVACSEDEGAPVTPSFPEEEQILSVKAGESVEIVFDASMDWKLYSSTSHRHGATGCPAAPIAHPLPPPWVLSRGASAPIPLETMETKNPKSPSQLNDGIDGVIVPDSIEGAADGIEAFLKDKDKQNRIIAYLKAHHYGNEFEAKKIDKLLNE